MWRKATSVNRASVIQMMTWRLFGVKPFPESILTYCKLDPKEIPSIKVQISSANKMLFIKCRLQHLQNVGHFSGLDVSRVHVCVQNACHSLDRVYLLWLHQGISPVWWKCICGPRYDTRFGTWVSYMRGVKYWSDNSKADILQRTFSNSFLDESCISLKFVTICMSALVQVMAWRRSGDKPLPEPMMT